ncbi:MAG: MarR family transcriptional regulator [Myxococcota bacterium]
MEATTAPSPISSEIEPDFIPGIRLLARLARVAERACQESGISLPQYRLLVSISNRPQRASDLAVRVGVSRPTLTSLVDGLAQGNLLRRVPVPTDRRGIQLEATEEGRVAMGRAESVLSRRFLELVPPDLASTVAPVVVAMEAALNQVAESS